MNAVVLTATGGPENFELQAVPDPAPAPGTALVSIRAAAFNPIDYQMRRGDSESRLLRSPILGRELAGVVLACGEGVTTFAPGDAVYGYISNLASNGAYAEQAAVPADLLAPMPSGLSFAAAAAIPLVGLTAVQAIEKTLARPDEGILVTGGAGGVGSMLLRLLVAAGHHNVLTTAGNAASRAAIRAMGLPDEAIVDYRSEELATAVHTRWQGAPADLVLDTVGGSIAEKAAALLRPHGRFADITYQLNEATRDLLFEKGITVHCISNYASATSGDLEYYGTRLRKLTTLLETGSLAPTPILIVGPLSAQAVREAHELMEVNKTEGRKLVMTVEA